MKKHTYRTVELKAVRAAELLPQLESGCIVAIDVAKQRMVFALATATGEILKLVRFEHPTETRAFLELVQVLSAGLGPGKLKVVLEPTGTYGDAMQHQLGTVLQLPVLLMSPKRTHDSQALFDGVTSLHDPKSAVLLAKLCAMQLASEWKAPEPWRIQLRALLEHRKHLREQEERCLGKLEALLARHWPEFGRWLDLREQKSALRLLSAFSGPADIEARRVEALAFLKRVSRGVFSPELYEGVLSDAATTLGLPMLQEEQQYLQALAREAEEARVQAQVLESRMHEVGQQSPAFVALEPWMGTWTAAVLVTLCDPARYESATQLEKACGLNVREKSSGEHKGRLAITKRGPGLVRQVLYLFALRMLQRSQVVRAWYEGRQGYTEESKQRAVVALMRKLVRAAFYVAKGETFDAAKLFDVRRLKIDESTSGEPRRIEPRTKPRSIAKGRAGKRVQVSQSR